MSTEQASAENTSAATGWPSPQSTPATQHAKTPNTPCEQLVEFTDQSGTRRRIRFVPQSDNADQWQRIEEVWRTREWQLVGQDTVAGLDHWTRPVQTS